MASKRFSALERNILLKKGLTTKALAALGKAGVRGKADFLTVGDAATLVELAAISREVADRVMAWATGAAPQPVLVDVMTCAHCAKQQPRDYKSGDLCVACGRQVEPVFACYWCTASGPGRFCRGCGAALVPPGELDLALLLKRDGLAKDEIPRRLSTLSPAEKEQLWARVRRRTG